MNKNRRTQNKKPSEWQQHYEGVSVFTCSMAWPTGRGPQPRDPRHRRELLACNERKEERSCTPLTELSVGGPRVHRHKQTVEKTVARYIRNTGVIKKNHHGRLIPFHRESRAPPPPSASSEVFKMALEREPYVHDQLGTAS